MRPAAEPLPDDARVVLGALDSRRPFAPSLPAGASGGFAVGGAVTVITAIVLLTGLSPTAPSGGFAHEFATLLRDGRGAGTSGPLWSMLALFLEGLPFGSSPVWRVTLLSALPTAAAAGLLAVWLRQRDIGRRAAVAAGLLFAFTLPVWNAAVLPGALPLAAMLSMLALVLVEEGNATGKSLPRRLGWGVLGLAALQGPAALGGALGVAAVVLLPRTRASIQPSSAAALLIGLGLGLLIGGGVGPLVATYLPHAAGWSPAAPVDAIVGLGHLSGPTGVAAALGLLLLWLRHPGDAGALTLLVTIPVLLALLLGARGGSTGEAHAFALAVPLTFAALAALAAAGIDAVLQRFAASPSPRAHAITALSALLPLAVIALGAPLADRSEATAGEEWANGVLGSLPEEAIIMTAPDPRGGLLEYVQLVGGVRPDVLVADPAGRLDPRRSPVLEIEPVPPDLSTAIPALRARTDRPLFSLTPVPTEGGRWQPWGLVWRWAPTTVASASEEDSAWEHLRFSALPSRPQQARSWIEETLTHPIPDPTTRRIAADYFQALARRDGKLSQIGPWATVLDHLDELRDPKHPATRASSARGTDARTPGDAD